MRYYTPCFAGVVFGIWHWTDRVVSCATPRPEGEDPDDPESEDRISRGVGDESPPVDAANKDLLDDWTDEDTVHKRILVLGGRTKMARGRGCKSQSNSNRATTEPP